MSRWLRAVAMLLALEDPAGAGSHVLVPSGSGHYRVRLSTGATFYFGATPGDRRRALLNVRRDLRRVLRGDNTCRGCA